MDSADMYREMILDLYKNPLNYGTVDHCTHQHHGNNPLCGDDITITLLVANNVVTDVKFSGKACALCTAAASLLTEKVKGMKVSDVMKLTKDDLLQLLKIPVSSVRLKCVLLGMETLHKALGDSR